MLHVKAMENLKLGARLKENIRRKLPVLAFLLVLLGTASCSSFNRDWKSGAKTPAPAGGIEGRWEGVWLSHTNGHHGQLRSLMSKQTDTQYQARFHAKFWKIFSYGYTVLLTARELDGAYQFQGDADLGWLAGGLYHYDGQATPTNFVSTYRSKHDGGVFHMERPRE